MATVTGSERRVPHAAENRFSLIQHSVLLQRNLLYTGITCGNKLVIIIGTKKALAMAIHNNKPQVRYTLLKERLMK